MEPSCTEPGLTEGSVCARCGEVLTAQEIIPPTGHTVVVDPAVEPTCTEAGLTAGAHCSVCNEVLAAQEEIAPLGHDPQVLPAVEPSCTEPGLTEGCVCARCGEILTAQEEVPALGHDYVAVVTAPSCTLDGFTTYTCSRCGDSCVDDAVPALGHSYGEPAWIWAKDNSLALASFVCSVCGDSKLLVAELTQEITRPATELEEGELTITAKVTLNGVEYTNVKVLPIEKLAHDCPCKDFVDMPEFGTPEHDAIDWAFTHGITAGVNATHFGGDKVVTRAQAMTFLWTAQGRPQPETQTSPFSDVPDGTWYTKAVLWAVENGITTGTGNGRFSPNKTCKRSEILLFLYAAVGKPGYTAQNPYSDVDDNAWYRSAAIWAWENGIEKGEDNQFLPSTDCTRLSTVLYLYRFMTGQGLAE